MAKTIETQLVVVGGGPGGYPAAFMAADHGLKVTLVDMEDNPGGVCLYRGCIPSKALLHMASLLNEVKEAESCGVSFGKPKIDVGQLRAWKDSVVQRLTGGLGQLGKQRKVDFVKGRARFTDATSLVVTTDDGDVTVSFEQAILATGSRPAMIPFADGVKGVMDSTGALALEDIPKTLLVIGGGYIGLELGQAYAAFGSDVTVVEMLPDLLANADRDLVQVLEKRLKEQFKEILAETKVAGLKNEGSHVVVSLESKDGKALKRTFDKVLISVGRRPNTADLGLEEIGIAVTDKGFVEVDPQRRTAVNHIFAIGDVAGEPMLAHKATAEARVAVEAMRGLKSIFDPAAIPGVVFTDPEIAWCGLTEHEAKSQGVDVKVSKFPWAASGRATTLGRNDGLTKVIADAATERILGMGIAGPGAGEMIAEGVLAIEMGAVAEDLALTIHAHPTLSETVMEAAEGISGQAVHFARKR